MYSVFQEYFLCMNISLWLLGHKIIFKDMVLFWRLGYFMHRCRCMYAHRLCPQDCFWGDVSQEIKQLLRSPARMFECNRRVATSDRWLGLRQILKVPFVQCSRSVFHLTQLCVPHLIKTKGSIVNVSSVNGQRSVGIKQLATCFCCLCVFVNVYLVFFFL